MILMKLRQAKNDVELGGYITVRTKVAAGDSHCREEILLYYMMWQTRYSDVAAIFGNTTE